MVIQSISPAQLLHETDLASRVKDAGWFFTSLGDRAGNMVAELRTLASRLGEPMAGRAGQQIETLSPLHPTEAKPKSLSVLHGLASFPLHTDGAHLLHPPRFVMLACVTPGSRGVPTVVVRLRDIRLDEPAMQCLRTAPFLVRNGRRSFYSTICDFDRPFIRFDPGCMTALHANGRAAIDLLSDRTAKCDRSAVDWQAGHILIIDNWTVLHGRGHFNSVASPDRTLLRMSIQ
jgi:alpha-ketoglutarate-dependent taurine dioxygenase